MKSRVPSAVLLIDEGTHLLRQVPVGVFLTYYLGSIPFILGLIHFTAEMTLSSLAINRLIFSSLVLSVLFIWMKCWQSIFAKQLYGYLVHEQTSRRPLNYTIRQVLRLVVGHMIHQPWSFIALPVSFILTIPFGWMFAYYQNLTILACLKNEGGENTGKAASELASMWWKQNHGIMGILCLFSLFVFINLIVKGLFLPQLLKTLMGVETSFSQAGSHLLNSTFIFACLGVTYLLVDPLIKAIYLLRCFYGQAQKNGQDLVADIKRFKGLAKAGVLCVLMMLPLSLRAVNESENEQKRIGTTMELGLEERVPLVQEQDLEREIDRVLSQENMNGDFQKWILMRTLQVDSYNQWLMESAGC